jgi:osmotically-inducible protein OsmY
MANRDNWRDEDDRSYHDRGSDWRSRDYDDDNDFRRRQSFESDRSSRYGGSYDRDYSRSEYGRGRASGYGREFGGSLTGSQYGQREWDENGYRGRYAGEDWRRSQRPGSPYDYDPYSRGEYSTGIGGSGRYGYASGSADRGYGNYEDRWQYSRDYRGHDRPWWDRATDEVSSWFGDEAAARRRRMDARGRGPKNYTRSTDRIREDVNDRLTDDPLVDAMEIEVAVSGTEVTLTGTVGTREERRRAEDVAESVSGVTHVQNNLRVDATHSTWAQQGTAAPTSGQTASITSAGSTTGQTGRTAGSRKNR